MISKPLNVACTSDLHMGHRRTPTAKVIKSFDDLILADPVNKQLDILWLAGDVFDNLLDLPDPVVLPIDEWMIRLMTFCAQHGIILRILEGTPLHDRKQSRRWTALNEMAGIGADVKYFEELTVEYIEKHNIHVLYIPDEWRGSVDKALEEAKDLIRAKGLVKVDFAVMHGVFDFQLPEVEKAQKHDSAEYLELVRHLIFIGHHHRHSSYRNIYAEGSLERLGHGEEHDKGYLRATVYPNGEADVQFIVNRDAMIYVTVDCTELDLESSFDKIRKVADSVPDHSAIRVVAEPGNPLLLNMEQLIRYRPFISWTKQAKKANETTEEQLVVVEDAETYVPITITKDNIEELWMGRLAAGGATAEQLECASSMMPALL